MTMTLVGLGLALAAFGAPQAGLSPEVLLLARINQKMADNLSRAPNYTCLETIERSQRRSPSQKFEVVDTLRLEVALVNGKELFSWPGAGKFEEKEIGEIVAGGTLTTGDFAGHARMVFVSGLPTSTYAGEEVRQGRSVVRYDYQVAAFSSSYHVRVGEKQATVACRGSFWADRETRDLLRLDVRAAEIPPELGLSEAITVIDYGKVRVGSSDFLLPQSVEFVASQTSGYANRNRVEFSGCRQYVGEAIIAFEEPAAAPGVREKKGVEMELPAGLSFDTRLATPIRSQRSMVGDPVAAIVQADVKKDGTVVVPKGARLTGRIRRLEKHMDGSKYYVVGLEFDLLEWEGKQARFFAGLEEAGARMFLSGPKGLSPGYPTENANILLMRGGPGAGAFVVNGNKFDLSPGFRMVWRTAAPSKE
jgi:hypothetical protein